MARVTRKRAARILVVGSSNTDMVVRADRIPRSGETVLGRAFATFPGGKGANQAVAAARAGGKVRFVGRVGRDSLGATAIAGLVRDRIDVTRVIRDSRKPSGIALIMLAKDGENAIAVAPGANERLSRSDVRAARGLFRDTDIVLLQLETPLGSIVAATEEARRYGRTVILNPAPARKLPGSLLRDVTLLTPNQSEAEELTDIPIRTLASAKAAARKLRSRGVSIVIITLGRRGALVSTGKGETLVRGYAVKAVDTTAAGDVFNGALAVAMAERQPLLEAVRFANAAAALSVTKKGAQHSAPRRSAIDKMIRGKR